MGIVHALVPRYMGRGVDRDDLVQVGRMGLMRAAAKYDPGRGASYATVARKWVRSAMDLEVGTRGSVVHTGRWSGVRLSLASLDAEHETEENGGQSLHDRIPDCSAHDPSDIPEPSQVIPLDVLTGHQREVLDLRLLGTSTVDIARRLGVTHQAVTDAYRAAMRKLRRYLEPR